MSAQIKGTAVVWSVDGITCTGIGTFIGQSFSRSASSSQKEILGAAGDCVTKVYSNAKASAAKRFLEDLLAVIPFEILSVQVDGGSEFMAEFEDACASLSLEPIVLPPSRPTYNGGVERGNRTFKEEFYYRRDLLADSIGAINFELKKALKKYNTYRPHKNLDGLTPMQDIQNSC